MVRMSVKGNEMEAFLLVVVVMAVIALIRTIISKDSGPKGNYMARSQARIARAAYIDEELDRVVARGSVSREEIRAAVAELETLFTDQGNEKLPKELDNQAGWEHRDGYRQLMELIWQKARDIQDTGGVNIRQIDARMEEHGNSGRDHYHQERADNEELHRRLGRR